MQNIGVTELMIIVFVLGIVMIPGIFYLLTLQKTLERCSPECRTTTPGSVWFMLIPFYNIVWQFLLVARISESLHNEFNKRNMNEEPEPGKSLGITFCILNVCGIIPIIGVLAGIGGFVCWIIYWVKISGYSNKLAMPVNYYQ